MDDKNKISRVLCAVIACNTKVYKWCEKCELPLCSEHFQNHEVRKGCTTVLVRIIRTSFFNNLLKSKNKTNNIKR